MPQDESSPYTFPKKQDKERIANYEYFDRLYNGDHFEAFSWKGEKDFSAKYNKLRYLVANYSGLISHVMADMLFGEKITFDFTSQKNQTFMDLLIQDNQLKTQLYESALANSRRGDSLFKIRVGQRNPGIVTSPSTIIIEEISPSIYFPVLEQGGARYTPSQEVLAWTFKNGQTTYLHKETHMPGFIFHEIFNYDPGRCKIINEVPSENFGFPRIEETGVDRPLIFHVPNFRDGNGFWGTSDYQGLEPLFFAINNRLTKIDNVLDKHTDPILAVPPGVLDEDGSIKKEALGMFEVANDNPGFNKPEYIVWNANLESAEKQIDQLIELMYTMAEISPATVGANGKDGGTAESGRALKFRLLSTIRKRNRKIRYYDQIIKDMLKTSLELAIAHNITIDNLKAESAEQPSIDWGDGVINDEVEMTEVAVQRIDAGLSSRADEIARLDGVTPAEAKKKVAEIDKENLPKLKAEAEIAAASKGAFNPAAGGNTPQDGNAANGGNANAGNQNQGNTQPNQKQPAGK